MVNIWNEYPQSKPRNVGKYIGQFLEKDENEYFASSRYVVFVWKDETVYPNDFNDLKLLRWMEIPHY